MKGTEKLPSTITMWCVYWCTVETTEPIAPTRSEVFDMLHSRDESVDHMDLPTFPEDAEDARAGVPSVPDAQAEFLQGEHTAHHQPHLAGDVQIAKAPV